jgi:hypothetical protein
LFNEQRTRGSVAPHAQSDAWMGGGQAESGAIRPVRACAVRAAVRDGACRVETKTYSIYTIDKDSKQVIFTMGLWYLQPNPAEFSAPLETGKIQDA